LLINKLIRVYGILEHPQLCSVCDPASTLKKMGDEEKSKYAGLAQQNGCG
jgi:hypothetical protein